MAQFNRGDQLIQLDGQTWTVEDKGVAEDLFHNNSRIAMDLRDYMDSAGSLGEFAYLLENEKTRERYVFEAASAEDVFKLSEASYLVKLIDNLIVNENGVMSTFDVNVEPGTLKVENIDTGKAFIVRVTAA